MALLTKAEQQVTRRPDSYVPAHALAGLLRLRRPEEDRLGRNWAMHYGTGASVGVVRGLMAAAGLRGARSAVLFTPLRLTVDQTVENLTGAGAPPWTWPRAEQAIDVAGKATYAIVTGLLADRLVPPARSSALARRRGQGLRLPGFA